MLLWCVLSCLLDSFLWGRDVHLCMRLEISEDTVFDWLIKVTDREGKFTSKELVEVDALDEAVTEALLLGGQ